MSTQLPLEFIYKSRSLMTLVALHPTLYQVQDLSPDLNTQELEFLGVELKKTLENSLIEIRTFSKDPSHHQTILGKLDLNSYDKFFYDLNLKEWSFKELADYSLNSLANIGQIDFIKSMVKASSGDPLSEGQDPEVEFEELINQAGSLYDPENWYIVSHFDKDIGIVLPQAFYDKPSEGTLFYMGVYPEHRGNGHGLNIHTLGLNTLKLRGCSRYIGSTGNENKGMQMVFSRQNCNLKHHMTFYRI